jgi:hypothetical protein
VTWATSRLIVPLICHMSMPSLSIKFLIDKVPWASGRGKDSHRS